MVIRKNYKPKLFLVVLAFLFLYGIVIFRLFIIQIYNKDFFSVLAKQQYVTEIKTQPARALIFDRNNVRITLNKESLSAFILPHRFHEPKKTKSLLKKRFKHVYKKINTDKRRAALRQGLVPRQRRFLWLERHLSDERLQQIKSYHSKDIYFLAEPERFYPFPAAAHIIGFTNIDNVGIAGVELQFNGLVGGTPTTFVLEKDARSGYFYFHKDIKEKGEVGEAVTVTLDRNLQFFAHEELQKAVEKHQAKGGAVIIMDPDTGHILAMASNPTFDPNNLRNVKLEHTKNISVTECFELGISFIDQFPCYAHQNHEQSFHEKDEQFLFYKGVLLTNRVQAKVSVKKYTLEGKGLVLYRFLEDLFQRTGWKPSRVIFVDDLMPAPFLKSVKIAMKAMDIDFVGIHFTQEERHPKPIPFTSKATLNKQFQTLIKKRIWLPEKKQHIIKNVPTCKTLQLMVNETIKNYPIESVLLAFNIDRTLMYHHPLYYKTRKLLKNKKLSTLAYSDYISIAIQNHQIKVVNKAFPAWIRNLQQRNIKTICLSNSRIEKFGIIESIEKFRLQQLQSLGFYFTDPFSLYAPHDTKEFYENNEKFIYYKGHLLTNKITAKLRINNYEIKKKGLALYRLLEDIYKRTVWKPSLIILVDHYLENLKQVKVAAKVMNIDFIGIHYTEANFKQEENIYIPESRASQQLQTLLLQKRWSPET